MCKTISFVISFSVTFPGHLRRDTMEEDKTKLQQQLQQASTELDTCREHIATKNKENLKVELCKIYFTHVCQVLLTYIKLEKCQIVVNAPTTYCSDRNTDRRTDEQEQC